MRVSQAGVGGGGSLFPCSLPKLPYVPMFPHSLRMFLYCNFSNFVPCSQKLANVPLFPSIFCQCSLVPQNPWETLIHAHGFGQVIAEKCVGSGGGVLEQVLYGEAPPRDLTPYPFIYHFFKKGTPFVYLLLEKGTLFIYLLMNKSLKQEVFLSFFSRSA